MFHVNHVKISVNVILKIRILSFLGKNVSFSMFSFMRILIRSPISLLKFNLQYSVSSYNRCRTMFFKLVYCKKQSEVIWPSHAIIFCYSREKTYCSKLVCALTTGVHQMSLNMMIFDDFLPSKTSIYTLFENNTVQTHGQMDGQTDEHNLL